VVIGQGTRLFPDAGPDIALDLVDSRADSKGVTIQVYRPAGRPHYAPAAADWSTWHGAAVQWESIMDGCGLQRRQLADVSFGRMPVPQEGALMEQSGRNQWQLVANGGIKNGSNPANRCRGLRPVADRSAW
jgi:hypothetical protein